MWSLGTLMSWRRSSMCVASLDSSNLKLPGIRRIYSPPTLQSRCSNVILKLHRASVQPVTWVGLTCRTQSELAIELLIDACCRHGCTNASQFNMSSGSSLLRPPQLLLMHRPFVFSQRRFNWSTIFVSCCLTCSLDNATINPPTSLVYRVDLIGRWHESASW